MRICPENKRQEHTNPYCELTVDGLHKTFVGIQENTGLRPNTFIVSPDVYRKMVQDINVNRNYGAITPDYEENMNFFGMQTVVWP